MASKSPAESQGEPPQPRAFSSDLDLQNPKVITDLFEQAAHANFSEKTRTGSTVHLPSHHDLIMTGDLHDHGLNFKRICKLAALHTSPTRHVILHEVIHGPHLVNGCDMSIRTLARVAALKLQYPGQVHLLQSNHELSQLGGGDISKDGVSVVGTFNESVRLMYGQKADDIFNALRTYIASLVLAVRCPNGVICSHSVPSQHMLARFDPSVLDRIPTPEDLLPRGSAYDMVWGRNHTPDLAEKLAERWNVKLFVMGHQPAEMGYKIETPTMLVLASDHSHGMVLPINTSKAYDLDSLIGLLIPLASVVL